MFTQVCAKHKSSNGTVHDCTPSALPKIVSRRARAAVSVHLLLEVSSSSMQSCQVLMMHSIVLRLASRSRHAVTALCTCHRDAKVQLSFSACEGQADTLITSTIAAVLLSHSTVCSNSNAVCCT